MIPTTADFHDETGHRVRWLGALHGNADSDPDLDPCGASTPADSCWKPRPRRRSDAVLALLDAFTEHRDPAEPSRTSPSESATPSTAWRATS